jgi:hypothetical protein
MIDVHGGSSGMLATFVALKEGASRVILCGIPMSPDMQHYHDVKKGRPWLEAKKYHRHWVGAEQEMADRVRSMSGWTATLLGQPTKEWLER